MTLGFRSGRYKDTIVTFRMDDHLARFWYFGAWTVKDNRGIEEEGEPIRMTNAANGTLSVPADVERALADAFGDPEGRFQQRCKDLEQELQRAHEIIRSLSDAVAGRVRV